MIRSAELFEQFIFPDGTRSLGAVLCAVGLRGILSECAIKSRWPAMEAHSCAPCDIGCVVRVVNLCGQSCVDCGVCGGHLRWTDAAWYTGWRDPPSRTGTITISGSSSSYFQLINNICC